MLMSISLNPFVDRTPNPRAEFRRQIGLEPEAVGNPNNPDKIPYQNSNLSHKQHNEIFEGDSWSFSDKSSITEFNLRPKTFVSGSNDPGVSDAVFEKADEGLLGTSVGAKRSHAHFAMGQGSDVVNYEGNSQRNIVVLEMDSGYKKVDFELNGGDDKAVLFLNDSTGIIRIDGGKGFDTLEIHTPKTGTDFEVRYDNQLKTEDPNTRLLIQAPGIERVVHFRDGQLVSLAESP